MPKLKHLNENTATRHLFIMGKGHHTAHKGKGCDTWWRNPHGLLRHATRISVSDHYGPLPSSGELRELSDTTKGNSYWRYMSAAYGPRDQPGFTRSIAEAMLMQQRSNSSGEYPNLFSVPYPSSIHLSQRQLLGVARVGSGGDGGGGDEGIAAVGSAGVTDATTDQRPQPAMGKVLESTAAAAASTATAAASDDTLALATRNAEAAIAPPPWQWRGVRKVLMSFQGHWEHAGSVSDHGAPYFGGVRSRLKADCRAAGSGVCRYDTSTQGTHCSGHNGKWKLKSLVTLKQQATFCLEPGGDSPYRKSLSDSILAGCIPVIFSPYLQIVSAWHWSAFRNDSHVFIDPSKYERGEIDLVATLRAIPPARVATMQRAIAEHAQSFHYALDDSHGDAVEVLLKGAHQAGLDRARLLESQGALPKSRAPARSSAPSAQIIRKRHDNHVRTQT